MSQLIPFKFLFGIQISDFEESMNSFPAFVNRYLRQLNWWLNDMKKQSGILIIHKLLLSAKNSLSQVAWLTYGW